MASEASIQFNYEQAIGQAKKLEQLADELKTLANTNLDNTLSELSSNWSGESASAFLSKAEKAKSDILSNVKQLYDAASVVRESAENLRKAELIAKRMAEMVERLL